MIYSKYWKKKTAKQEYYTWQNQPSEMKKHSALFQTDKNWEILSPLVLPYKKCLREFFKLKSKHDKKAMQKHMKA